MDKRIVDRIRQKGYAENIMYEIVRCYGLGDVVTMLVDIARTRHQDDLDWDADFTLLCSIQGEIKN